MFKKRNAGNYSLISGLKSIPNNVFLLYFILTFVITLFFPKNNYSEYNYQVNDITREKIIAPFDFPILKTDQEVAQERQAAIRKIPAVFKGVEVSLQRSDLRALVEGLQSLSQQYQNLQDNENSATYSQDSSQFYRALENLK